MTAITYLVKGKDKNFQFKLWVIDDLNTSKGKRRRWEIVDSSGLGTWESQLRPPGSWQYKQYDPGRRGFLFFQLGDGRDHLPFVIALDEVPDDYLHGPFCSVASEKGTLSPSVEEDVPIVWQVAGPGCV